MYVYNLCNKEKQNKSKFPEFGDYLDNSHFANILLLIKTSKEE